MSRINSVSEDAARAMDTSNYPEVIRLFNQLRKEGFNPQDIRQAFRDVGADIANIPAQYAGRGSYMLGATMDPTFA